MTTTLQQALLKAGLVSEAQMKKVEEDKKRPKRSQQPQARFVPKDRNQSREARPATPPTAPRPADAAAKPAPRPAAPRPSAPRPRPEGKGNGPGFIENKHHHHIRVNCDACGKSSPDVEFYEHRKASLIHKWLCVRCADDNSISDEFRSTVQSQHAQSGMFRRNYGATKPFKKSR